MPVSFSVASVSTHLTAGFRLIAGDEFFQTFKKNLSDALQQVSGLVVIDFSECVLIDSTALGDLVAYNRSLLKCGRKLKFRNLNKQLSDLIKTVQLDRFFDVE